MSGAAFPAVARGAPRLAWRCGLPGRGLEESGDRALAEETPVALTYDGSTQAVMMATPADLEDFALGFSLAEGIIDAASEVESLDLIASPAGIEARMWLKAGTARALAARRRALAGPTGCGLCGVESLAEALAPVPRVDATLSLRPADLACAIASLPAKQRLNLETRSVHAAAYWTPRRGIVAVREDVGRHNALDKVAGALARSAHPFEPGVVLLTSRISVELVQKAARIGAPVLAAVSAPTALALRTAEAAGITLIGVARDDGFEVFSHPWRLADGPSHQVA